MAMAFADMAQMQPGQREFMQPTSGKAVKADCLCVHRARRVAVATPEQMIQMQGDFQRAGGTGRDKALADITQKLAASMQHTVSGGEGETHLRAIRLACQ